MTVAIAVRARLFARLREQAGTDTESIALRAGSTVADVYDALRRSHPGLEPNRDAVRGAVNQEFADWDVIVADGDEVAFVPPVSGGAHGVGVLFELTSRPLDARRLEAAVAHAGAGAICTFTGVVRSSSRGRSVTHLEYEAYAEMAERRIRQILTECLESHGLQAIAAEHRVGSVPLGETSVIVAVSGAHREETFAGAREAIDRIKAEVPIWKRELEGGDARWVEGVLP